MRRVSFHPAPSGYLALLVICFLCPLSGCTEESEDTLRESPPGDATEMLAADRPITSARQVAETVFQQSGMQVAD